MNDDGDVDDSSLPADSQLKWVGLVWELVDTWRWVCYHQMKRMNYYYSYSSFFIIIIIW